MHQTVFCTGPNAFSHGRIPPCRGRAYPGSPNSAVCGPRNPNWPKRSDGDGRFRTEACRAQLGRLLSIRVINPNLISSLITPLLRQLMNLAHDCEVCEYVEWCGGRGRREGETIVISEPDCSAARRGEMTSMLPVA